MLFLYLSLPILCLAAIPCSRRKGALAERLVYGIGLYAFLLYMAGTALGLAGKLAPAPYTAVNVLVVLCLALLAWRARGDWSCNFFPWRRWLRTRRGMAAFFLLLVTAFAFTLQIGFDGLYGTRHFDGLWYHIPRVLFWLQTGSFDAWPTPAWAQVGLPVGADVILGHKILLGGSWTGIGYVTGIFTLGTAACVYLAALDFKLPRWHALLAALLFCSFPAIGMRIWTVNSDIVASFLVLAAYLALRRIGSTGVGLAAYMVLNGLALACKPTVAPQMLLLGMVGAWQCRQRLAAFRSPLLPLAAAALAAAIVISSYWPVYRAFDDFQGGDGGRRHKVASVQEFGRAAAMSAFHWLAEPLGYLHAGDGGGVKQITEPVYRALGGELADSPGSWAPSPNQDTGRSGFALVWMAPVLLLGFSPALRVRLAGLFLLGFLPLSGMVHFRPWNARYTIIVLAGYALLWLGSDLLRHGFRRWIVAGITGLNLLALVGISSIVIYKDKTIHSQPGGYYSLIEPPDRDLMRRTMGDAPLLIVTQETPDALLTGPGLDFRMKYLLCRENGAWEEELRQAASESNWLALYHGDSQADWPSPIWHRPTQHNRAPVSLSSLKGALIAAGWKLHRKNRQVDLWFHPGNAVTAENL